MWEQLWKFVIEFVNRAMVWFVLIVAAVLLGIVAFNVSTGKGCFDLGIVKAGSPAACSGKLIQRLQPLEVGEFRGGNLGEPTSKYYIQQSEEYAFCSISGIQSNRAPSAGANDRVVCSLTVSPNDKRWRVAVDPGERCTITCFKFAP
jgi:hypothetical protein